MKLLKNNNVGVIFTLILVILLSQSKFFDFLINTYLGRFLLITFICLIAYSNKMTGLVAVLFIIIAFNYNDVNVIQSYNYYEGFTDGNIKDQLKDKIQKLKDKKPTETTTVTTDITPKTSNPEGREGFCMSDRELNILRGKQSNTISISKSQNDDVLPSEKSIFSDLLTPFN